MDNNSSEQKIKKPNPWMEHIKKVRKENPDVMDKNVLKLAETHTTLSEKH